METGNDMMEKDIGKAEEMEERSDPNISKKQHLKGFTTARRPENSYR